MINCDGLTRYQSKEILNNYHNYLDKLDLGSNVKNIVIPVTYQKTEIKTIFPVNSETYNNKEIIDKMIELLSKEDIPETNKMEIRKMIRLIKFKTLNL